MSAAGMDSAGDEAFSGTKPVEERHRLDEHRLDLWMKANIEGYAGPMRLSQFKGGQSNPTYRIDTPGVAYVLRRKPFGKLLPSAHAVDREFKVISALFATGFPVARAYRLCLDEAVIGAAFYVMSMVEGRSLWNGALPGFSRAERRAVYEEAISTLARLHQLDADRIGLGDYGRPGNYFARQIDRWTRQYRASEMERIEAMDQLIAYLSGSVPDQERISIVHGDFRLDNMIYAPDAPKVLAVLDWELSTLGDPLADFTYLLMQWVTPEDGRSGIQGLDLPALGIPSLDEAIAQYCRLTGRAGLPAIEWYFAYNMFRIAAILQGIAGRVRDGTASSPQAVTMAARRGPLAEQGWAFALKAQEKGRA